MPLARRSILAAAALAAGAGTALTLHEADAAVAPTAIGNGWTEYSPGQNLQIETHDKITSYPGTTTHEASAGGSYDRNGAVETFKLFNHDVSNRVEKRITEEYRTGMRQFEGDLLVVGPTDNESVMQIFGMNGGSSMLMIRAYIANGGTLRAMGMNAVLATGVYGRSVHLNVVHDATGNTVSIYVNGKQAGTWRTPNGNHYFKYGVYGTLRTATAHVQWSNVRFYRK